MTIGRLLSTAALVAALGSSSAAWADNAPPASPPARLPHARLTHPRHRGDGERHEAKRHAEAAEDLRHEEIARADQSLAVSAMVSMATGLTLARFGSKPIIAVGGFSLAIILPTLTLAPDPTALAVALLLFGAATTVGIGTNRQVQLAFRLNF